MGRQRCRLPDICQCVSSNEIGGYKGWKTIYEGVLGYVWKWYIFILLSFHSLESSLVATLNSRKRWEVQIPIHNSILWNGEHKYLCFFSLLQTKKSKYPSHDSNPVYLFPKSMLLNTGNQKGHYKPCTVPKCYTCFK